jgi:hypothetical protein
VKRICVNNVRKAYSLHLRIRNVSQIVVLECMQKETNVCHVKKDVTNAV